MRLRRLLASATVVGALLVGGAVGAAAATYEPAPTQQGCTQGTVFDLGNVIPCGASNVPSWITHAQVTVSGVGGTVNPAANTISTAAATLIPIPAHRNLAFTFTPPSVGQFTIEAVAADAAGNVIMRDGAPVVLCASAFRVVPAAAGGGAGGGGNRAPQHPATGAQTALYAVGGLLLATAGVTLVVSARRRRMSAV